MLNLTTETMVHSTGLTGIHNNIVACSLSMAKSEAGKAANRKYSKKTSVWRKQEKIKKIRRDLEEKVGNLTIFLDSLEGKDRILFDEFLKGTTQDKIAKLIGKQDRRFVATRKQQILEKWERKRRKRE